MMILAQAGDTAAVDLLAQMFLAQVKQGPRIVVDKLGVALEAQHLIIDVVGGKRAEITGSNDRGVLRQGRNLVLMADQQRQVLDHRVHPRCLGSQFVLVGAHAPALSGALALATQQQRQQLMAKANAQQLVTALVAGQQVGFEGLNPRIGAK